MSAVSKSEGGVWRQWGGASSKGSFSVINRFISFSTLVTRHLLFIYSEAAYFSHAPILRMQLLSLHQSQMGKKKETPINHIPFPTNFKKLGGPPFHRARTILGGLDTLDLVAVELPTCSDAGGWMR